MRTVLLFLGLLAFAAATTEYEYQTAFIEYQKEFGKVYTSGEFIRRYTAFKENYDYINHWNAQGSETVLGTTIMSDLTNKEYQRLYLGTPIDASNIPFEFSDEVMPEAATVDWRTKGAVTGVKNQGQCGSCWSFSTTGSVEGVHQIATGRLVSLSEQNLMDCSGSYGNQGCNGGLMTSAMRYIIANKGIDTEASYPYQGRQGTCHYSAANIGATISSLVNVASRNEGSLLTGVNKNPVSVAIDASHPSFQNYRSGVYYEPACSSTSLDHGVLAIGYGTDNGSDYWLVKNSWGASWGMSGYIEMSRNKNNNCGIATSASYPVA